MASAFQVGRAGADVGELVVNQADLAGDILTVSGYATANTEDDVKALRQQLLGLGNPDEPIVPVQFTGDTTHNGFYEVGSVNVNAPDRGTGQVVGVLEYSLTLRRIAGYSYPLIQSVAALFVRANAVGIAGTTGGYWAVPAACTETIYSSNLAEIAGTRTSSDGNLSLYNNSATPGIFTYSYGCAAADYYTGAAKIEAGSALNVIVGRQADATHLTPALWRLSNGLLRVTPTLSGGVSTGGLNVKWYDGSSYEPSAGKAFTIRDRASGNAIGAFTSVRILRNTPEVCTMRFSALMPGYSVGFYANIDLSLRRGARQLEIYCDGGVLTSTTWQVRLATAEAATSTTGGIRATANDADGNQYVINMTGTATKDLVNGRIGLTTGAQTAQFGFGVSIGGSGAVGTDEGATAVEGQYFGALVEHQTVVGR